MRPNHRIALAAAFAVTAAVGTAAATQTMHLDAEKKEPATISAPALATQKSTLADADRSGEKALAARAPALPEVPRSNDSGDPTVAPRVAPRVAAVPSPSSPSAPATSASTPTPALEAPVVRSTDETSDALASAPTPAPAATPAPPTAEPNGEDHPEKVDHQEQADHHEADTGNGGDDGADAEASAPESHDD